MNASPPKFEFLTFNFRQIVIFWHPLRLFQFPLTWEFLENWNYRISDVYKNMLILCLPPKSQLICYVLICICIVSKQFLYLWYKFCICDRIFVFVIQILYLWYNFCICNTNSVCDSIVFVLVICLLFTYCIIPLLMSLPPKFHCSPVQLFCTELLPMILPASYFRRK